MDPFIFQISLNMILQCFLNNICIFLFYALSVSTCNNVLTWSRQPNGTALEVPYNTLHSKSYSIVRDLL